jgi:hypothetical protein
MNAPAPETKPKAYKAEDVRAAMRRRYCDPEWAILFEVRNATGHVRHARSADAVAMSLWPSRGLELHGFEIKVSRSDWLNERKKPEKAETIAAYCDRWYLVTANNVVSDASEVPPAWGWIELTPDGKLREVRAAAKTDAKVADRNFLAALLRRVHRVDESEIEAIVKERMADKEADFSKRVDAGIASRIAHRNELAKTVEAFEAASGLKISDPYFYSGKELGRLVKALRDSDVDCAYGGLQATARRLRESADRIEGAMKELRLEAHPVPELKKRGLGI